MDAGRRCRRRDERRCTPCDDAYLQEPGTPTCLVHRPRPPMMQCCAPPVRGRYRMQETRTFPTPQRRGARPKRTVAGTRLLSPGGAAGPMVVVHCGDGGTTMALATKTMTDEQRKSVALEYLKAFDRGGVTSDGASILDLFADDAQVYFPKWGLANGKAQIEQLFGDVGGTLKSIVHHYAQFNWIFSG